MKRTFLTLLITAFILSCGNKEKENEAESEDIQEEIVEMEEIHPDDLPVLIGKHEVNAIMSPPYTNWFIENYQYNPDQKKLEPLKDALKNKTITIFMGTWCSDSRTQVPALLNVLDAINYDISKITLITMSEDKDTPEGFEDGKNIEYVPTIIVYNNNIEMGRIVEYPIENLESDLLKIATGLEYTPAYSE
jgi:thiol-disulfide isomerase/thioredoxin